MISPISTPPIASIIIPTYNRSVLLEYTLTSVYNQSISQSLLEIIVVDDGSNDNTVEIIEKFKPILNLKYFYQEDKGYRVASARNIGIQNAIGEICIFVDSGVILSSKCIFEHIKSHKDADVPLAVIGYVYGFDQSNQFGDLIKKNIDWKSPDLSIEILKKQSIFLDLRETFYEKYSEEINLLPAPWVVCWTCNISASKALLDKIGGFDTNYDYNWGVEDLDLGYRLYLENVYFKLNRDAASIHYPHYKDESLKNQAEAINKTYFYKKFKNLETKFFLSSDWYQLNALLLNYKENVLK